MADPTILPRRVLERQARLHQWLQDVADLTASERQLAVYLINRGDEYLGTFKSYATIAELNGGTSETTVKRAVAGLVRRGLLDVTQRRKGRGIQTSNLIRLRAPAALLELRLSDADLKAGADPLDADFELAGAGEAISTGREANLAERSQAISTEPERQAISTEPVNGSSKPDAGKADVTDPDSPSEANMAYGLSSSKEVEEREESPSANLTEPTTPPFAGSRPRLPRAAADVFAAMRPAS